MIKKITFLVFLFFLIFSNIISNSNIAIIIKVNDEIITNYDVEKEINYLKILNPNLNSLNKDQIMILAKSSLVNEIIKKKEIIKLIDITSKNQMEEGYLKNLLNKLNFNNEDEFEKELKNKSNYNLSEVKQKIKIDLFWNELIYSRFNNQVKIDKDKIIKKVESLENQTQQEYSLSEIVFVKKKDLSIENLIDQIKLSITEIGFNNTANIYSISESSKLGGKLGWINKNSLSKIILKELGLISEGNYTSVIKMGNNYLILKLEQIKNRKIKIDKNKEINDLIKAEKNKQLNQFSRIYFDKLKINYSIDEK